MGALGQNDNSSQQSTSQGGNGSSLNIKNSKNVLSGPLHSKINNYKPVGSSHMDQREKKMKDAYKNAKPKGKGVVGIGGLNNQAVL